MAKKPVKRTRGDRRTNKQIKASQEQMFNWMAQGFSKKSIIEMATKKFGVSTVTVWRYWNGMWESIAEQYEEEADKEIKAFRAKAKSRMERAAFNFFRNQDRDSGKANEWLKSWREEEYNYMKFLQSIGIVQRAPEDVNVNVSSKTDEKLEELNAILGKARDSISKEEKDS